MGAQDVSAVLMLNGEVIAAVEEERLSRIKFSAGRLPFLAVQEVLKIGKINIQEVSLVAFHGSTWEKEIEARIGDYFKFHFGHVPTIKRYHHHDCHAASAFYASGFDDALILTMDNSGDGVSTQVSVGEKGQIKSYQRFDRYNSLGFYYSLITQYCGFIKDSDEFKLMGLSSYGDRNKFDFSWLIDFKDGQLKTNKDFVLSVPPGAAPLHKDEMNFNAKVLEKMGDGRRLPGQSITQNYKNVAASAQRHLEDVVLKMLKHFVLLTGKRRICLAGGVALNCLMNQRIMNEDFVQDFFVQPASSDAGISLGAAWMACVEMGIAPQKTNHTYLGNSFTNDEIKTVLNQCGLKYSHLNDPAESAAELIAQNKIVGWFQGRMEFGPRALGNRSILANPTVPEMKTLLNEKIKLREEFRPFCPSVLEEDAPTYFEGKLLPAPYMTTTYNVVEKMINQLPAVTQVDGTARIQTINEGQNSLFSHLIGSLKKKTGYGVVLNTSFNLSHEPIVSKPRHALATFFSSGLDALVMGNYLVEK